MAHLQTPLRYRYILTDKNFVEISELKRIRKRQYSKFINNVGQAYFEMLQDNPVLREITDSENRTLDFLNRIYGLKIYRDEQLVWRGLIDELVPQDKKVSSMDIIGFRASSRLQDFGDILINASPDNPAQRVGLANKKMGTEVVQPFFEECVAKENSPISDVLLGTITNPVDSTGAEVTMGTQDALPMMDLLTAVDFAASVSFADYWYEDLTNEFNFAANKGVERDVLFRFIDGAQGNNIRDFAITLDIRGVTNNPIGFAAGEGANLKIIHEIKDDESIGKFRLRQRMLDIRTLDTETNIREHLRKQLSQLKMPKYYSSLSLMPGTVPFLGWGLGDVIKVQVKRGIFNFAQPERKRVMGATIEIDDTNVEHTQIHFGEPK